jgi:hypothetical protein
MKSRKPTEAFPMNIEAKHPTIDVTVKYVAGKPFHEHEAPRTETLLTLKGRVLKHFGLEETSTPEFQKTYFLYGHGGRIDNLAQTLGEYAGHHHKIELKLVEQIVQGLGGAPPSADAVMLEEHFSAVIAAADEPRWELRREGWMEVWATLAPKAAPEQKFFLRLLWQRYPHDAPSIKFRDLEGRIDNPRAWPAMPGYRPTSLDACVNYSAEGFALHPEWKTDPRYKWDPRGNALLRVLTLVQTDFDLNYQGRFAG